MAGIEITGVPQETLAVLRQRAARAHQSLEEFVLGLLITESARRPWTSLSIPQAAGPAASSASPRRSNWSGTTEFDADPVLIVAPVDDAPARVQQIVKNRSAVRTPRTNYIFIQMGGGFSQDQA